ncbi:peptidase M14 [Paenibacillus cisolokensis]|uniref:Peptidase M14 n=1 Tax=Paenibacillus cisolokensis TaxID=1658519 RepID=A0ABQ4N894_9BACL|nr:M14 family metallopeptidase [Paenibacillus cisolokensis]GIQ64407.1 peptidase M14 [Paenibacillus cisolokensis]
MLTYAVRPGDTYLRIARKFGVNPYALYAANPAIAPGEYAQPGDLLRIPARPARLRVLQPGDTPDSLSGRYGIPADAWIGCNPALAAGGWHPGTVAVVPPAGTPGIVDATAEYGYRDMMADCAALKKRYPSWLELTVIGTSVLGKPLPAMRIGGGPRRLHVNASFHANEWITSALLMRFAERLAAACASGGEIAGEPARELCGRTTLWLVPMVNPDGVELVQEGVRPDHPFYRELLRWNRGSRRFDRWKANVRGVDLNDQFPAHWEAECERRDTAGPGPRDYPGPSPLSEPEAAAMAAFAEAHRFDAVVALHTQGQEIYWNYRDYEPPESERLAQRLGRACGYRPVKLSGSDAGFKDWFIQRFRRPGFTVEVGLGVNPLPLERFPEYYEEVERLLAEAMKP